MNIKDYSKEYKGFREDQVALMFLICFNLIDDNSKYTSGEIRSMVYDMMDAIE